MTETQQAGGVATRGPENITSELLYDLDQFRVVSVELNRLLESEDYGRVKILLETRGEILNRLRVLSLERKSELRFGQETLRQCRMIRVDIESSACEFNRVKSEKEEELLTRLHQLNKHQSNQLYKKQD
ncbi:MAG: hypothetical protein NTU47_16325 [Ignavibacteriales bacterium]|nr:hypothetical protein [Ignavibacteriales bacterium]